jgi:hypothetical protein
MSSLFSFQGTLHFTLFVPLSRGDKYDTTTLLDISQHLFSIFL